VSISQNFSELNKALGKSFEGLTGGSEGRFGKMGWDWERGIS